MHSNLSPILDSGFNTLFIGLFCKDESPVNVALIPCPAKKPINSLAVVPEFPQSKGWLGSLSLEPLILISPLSLENFRPHFDKQSNVEIQSLPLA